MTATAYSYTRFSTPEQSEGTSKERQDASVAAWLKTNPTYELNSTLNFHDAGVSAFRGRNAKVGKLAAFLKLIEQGRIAPGSVLLVEEWSRFSRQNPYDGAPVSRQIFDAGVGIVDLRNNIRYDAMTMRDQVIRIRLELEWERAYQESQVKAERVVAAWGSNLKRAASQDHKLTPICPAWLRLVDGKFKVIPEAAAAINLVFTWYAAGIGKRSICERLNADKSIWRTGHGWSKGYLDKLLKWRAVLGEYQPLDSQRQPLADPIPKYYPPIIDEALFHQVQAVLARNAALPGRGGGANNTINNVFGHICRCGRCGGRMTYQSKGRPPKGGQYLVCDKGQRGLGCNPKLIRYSTLEPLLLRLCRGLDPRDLLTDEADRSREVLHRQALEGELGQIERQVDNLADQIANTDSAAVRQILDSKLNEKLARKAELEHEVSKIFDTSRANTAEAVVQHLANVDDLITRMEELKGAERSALRLRLRSALHSLIERLDINPSQHEAELTVTFRDGAVLRLVLDGKGALRLADDGSRLYWIDENGVVDVDPIGDESTEAEQLERQRRVNALVAKALRDCRLNPQIAAARHSRPRNRAWRRSGRRGTGPAAG